MIEAIFAKYADPNMVLTYGTEQTRYADRHVNCSCIRCADYRAVLDIEPLPTDVERMIWGWRCAGCRRSDGASISEPAVCVDCSH